MKISPDDYGIHNDMEDVAELAIQQVLSEDRTACSCPLCRVDMKSLILNRLTPLYRPISKENTTKREIRLSDLNRDLFNQVVAESYRALARVKSEPRHDFNRSFLHNSLEEIVVCALQDTLRQEKR